MNWFEKIMNGMNDALKEIIKGIEKGIDAFIEEINDKDVLPHDPEFISVKLYDADLGDYINYIFSPELIEKARKKAWRKLNESS